MKRAGPGRRGSVPLDEPDAPPDMSEDAQEEPTVDPASLKSLMEMGFSRDQARAWLLRVTQDTTPGTPDFVD